MNNKKNHTHTPTHISKTIENIIYIYTYKFNKAKSSCKLKTYTHVIVLAKKATIHVCSVAQVHSTSKQIESNLLPKNAHSCRSFIVQLSLEM